MAWSTALEKIELEDEEVVRVELHGRNIAVCRVGDEFYALDNVCTHGNAMLSDGFVEEDCIECPLHQGRFSLKTGEPQGPPVSEPVKTYPVMIADGKLLIDIPSGEGQ